MQFLMLNSSSSHADNHKNNFVVWGEGPTCDINGIFMFYNHGHNILRFLIV